MVCGVCGLCLRDDGTRSLLMDEKVFTSTGPSSGGDPIDNQHLLKQRKSLYCCTPQLQESQWLCYCVSYFMMYF